MRSTRLTLFAALAAALACSGAATAARIGVNDDSAKYADDAGAWFYGQAGTLG